MRDSSVAFTGTPKVRDTTESKAYCNLLLPDSRVT